MAPTTVAPRLYDGKSTLPIETVLSCAPRRAGGDSVEVLPLPLLAPIDPVCDIAPATVDVGTSAFMRDADCFRETMMASYRAKMAGRAYY